LSVALKAFHGLFQQFEPAVEGLHGLLVLIEFFVEKGQFDFGLLDPMLPVGGV
jgi:hypothetical protein